MGTFDFFPRGAKHCLPHPAAELLVSRLVDQAAGATTAGRTFIGVLTTDYLRYLLKSP